MENNKKIVEQVLDNWTTDDKYKAEEVKSHPKTSTDGLVYKIPDNSEVNLDSYSGNLGPKILISPEKFYEFSHLGCEVFYDDKAKRYYYFPKTCLKYKQRKQKEQQEKENKISTIDSFLKNFNIKNYRDYLSQESNIDEFNKIKEEIRSSLQTLNDKGFVGNIFTTYNNLMGDDLTYVPKKENVGYVDDTNLVNLMYEWNIDKTKYPIYRPNTVTLLTKENCRKYLIDYLKSAIFSSVDRTDFIIYNLYTYKETIERCSVEGNYKDLKTTGITKTEVLGDSDITPTPFDVYGKKNGGKLMWSNIVKYLKSKSRNDIRFWESKEYNGSYVMPGNQHGTNNLIENTLKLKIKSNLNEIILDKSRDELKETIIKNRVKFIFEKEEFKTEKEKINFVVNLLEESLSLKKQGFGNDLINEEFWDVTRGFFIDQNSKSFLNLFKQKTTEWLVENVKKDPKLTPIIKEVISEINISNINNMTDQNFLVRQISNKLMLKNKQLTESHRVNEFKKEIQNRVSKVIIPIFEDTSDKFDLTFKKLKVR